MMIMRRIEILIAAALLGLVGRPVFAGDGDQAWQVDAAHTRVGFSVSHLGINTVHGQLKKFTAEATAGEDGKLTAVSAKVRVDSVDTGNDKRDAHLRAEDVFNAAKYPEMIFKTRQITWFGKSFRGNGELTIRGVTRKMAFTGKMTGVKKGEEGGKTVTRVGFQVKAEIDRTAFGITFGGFSEGLGMVGEKVSVVINAEILR